jgi:hypothetical protein
MVAFGLQIGERKLHLYPALVAHQFMPFVYYYTAKIFEKGFGILLGQEYVQRFWSGNQAFRRISFETRTGLCIRIPIPHCYHPR